MPFARLHKITFFVVFIAVYKFFDSKFELVLGGLIVGGAIGNYIDRLFRGYVVDLLDFKIWPIFNLADVFIVVGCIMFVFMSILSKKNINK